MGDEDLAEKAAIRPRRSRTKLRYRLRSFRAENGFPYDQYVWVYSRLYAVTMRCLHARGRHWHKRTLAGQLWCHWCGDRQPVPSDEGGDE